MFRPNAVSPYSPHSTEAETRIHFPPAHSRHQGTVNVHREEAASPVSDLEPVSGWPDAETGINNGGYSSLNSDKDCGAWSEHVQSEDVSFHAARTNNARLNDPVPRSDSFQFAVNSNGNDKNNSHNVHSNNNNNNSSLNSNLTSTSDIMEPNVRAGDGWEPVRQEASRHHHPVGLNSSGAGINHKQHKGSPLAGRQLFDPESDFRHQQEESQYEYENDHEYELDDEEYDCEEDDDEDERDVSKDDILRQRRQWETGQMPASRPHERFHSVPQTKETGAIPKQHSALAASSSPAVKQKKRRRRKRRELGNLTLSSGGGDQGSDSLASPAHPDLIVAIPMDDLPHPRSYNNNNNNDKKSSKPGSKSKGYASYPTQCS